MASHNEKGRDKGSRRESAGKARRRRFALEALEDRLMLSGGPNLGGAPTWHPTTTNINDVKNGPLANAGQTLISVYNEYQAYAQSNPSTPYTSTYSNLLNFSGTSVGVQIGFYGSQASAITALKNLGMSVTSAQTLPNEVYVTGYLPIAKLPTAAALSGVVGISPTYKPTYFYTGSANNEGETALGAPAARTAYGVNGAGVTVGVISGSVSKFAGGIADSVRTGDIPSASRVNVLNDSATAAGATDDEGRAMIENIFDIAPGVNTAFYTASDPNQPGDAGFATAVTSLASAGGAKVIVDDVGILDDPAFQTGIIGNAINQVTASGTTYFSAAGNDDGTNGGYQSPFRSVSSNVTGVGQGTYFNFNPGGGTLTNLPITADGTGAILSLQWDQPFYTTNGVTTSLNLYVLDANNNVVASSTTNAVATQVPLQFVQLPSANPGTPVNYTVVVQVASGSAPGYIRLNAFGGDSVGGLTFTKPFGTAGGVSYPSAFGHNAMAGTGSTGAVPWWDTKAYQPNLSTPSISEPFSSSGPQLQIYNFDGSRLASPAVVQAPLFSATDGGNTSFFPEPAASNLLDTSNPPYKGAEAPTATNINPQPTLPSFFGTSSAAPNAAAVAALLKQYSPTSTPQQILSALATTATPLNGTAKGVYDIQGGFGLINASAALNAIGSLRVVSVVPGGGATVASAPTYVTVTFNRPVVFSTLNASALTVSGPSGTTVVVGAPIAVDNPTLPTIVRFPISIVRSTGANANGTYTETVSSSTLISSDGKTLAPFTTTFRLADTLPPKVTGLTINGRIIRISFSEPIDPATVSKGNFLLVRANNGLAPNPFYNNPNAVIVSNDPRAVLSYDPTTNTVTLDLSALNQSLLPTDYYALVVQSSADGQTTGAGVTDVVGNFLDGEYNNSFPSGDGIVGGPFNDLLGLETLTGPIFNSVQLAPASDSGILGDQDTRIQRPTFTGQIGANFPGTASGIIVVAEFGGINHNSTTTGRPLPAGTIDLAVGTGGRGFSGNYDVVAVTDASGRFTITAPSNLPDGLNTVQFVAIGQSENQVLPGLSTGTQIKFRVDTSLPTLQINSTHPSGASVPQGAVLNSLSGGISLYFTDPVNPSALGSAFAVPTLITNPALDPTTATNIGNYSLYRVASNNNLIDESSFIASAIYVDTTKRTLTSDPSTGTVSLAFNSGLPSGAYILVARTQEPGISGLRDAAGNPFGANPTATSTAQDFYLNFNFQPSPVYITSYTATSSDGSTAGPRAYYELTSPGATPRAAAPPTSFKLTFSNPLPLVDSTGAAINYNNVIQLFGSANTAGGTPDGDFGDLGSGDLGLNTSYSRINPTGTTVTLSSSNASATTLNTPGFQDTLTLTLPSGYTLPADNYRIYLSNTGATTITDIYGNKLDGEFLGNQTASGGYQDLLPNGQVRNGLSGDGVAGGAFMTGFVVVPNGTIIYANPSYNYDPLTASTTPDGSIAKPYPVLASQVPYTSANGGNLNSPINANNYSNLYSAYDRAGIGMFAPSAFYAASVASTRGPVVIVALPGAIIRDPSTGVVTQKSFVLQSPTGTDQFVNDGSAAVPAETTLVFAAGATLKLQNAALLVQNQGSALQVLGGSNPSDRVTFTSYADNTIATASSNAGDTTPRAGDWGGILLRNFNQVARSTLFPGQLALTGSMPTDRRLKGPGGADAISGADDVMSVINYANISYAGGTVPNTIGFRYDGITLQNARPAVTNTTVTLGGDAAVSTDVDSLREDNIARGTLFRNDSFTLNSINGIYIRPQDNGVAEPTNALSYDPNPSTLGGVRNFTLAAPYPYVINSNLNIGNVFQYEAGGATLGEADRLYIQPGTVVKLSSGGGIEVSSLGINAPLQPSLNVGSRTYINEFDTNPSFGPALSTGAANSAFQANPTTPATTLFTSAFDNAATTTYTDPVTGIVTTLVAPIDTLNSGGTNQPITGNVSNTARWGGIQVDSPGVAVITGATIQYGGGTVNVPTGTVQRHALQITGASGLISGGSSQGGGGIFGFQQGSGSHIYITNNNFYSNTAPGGAQAPIDITPDGLLAGDAQRPLLSGTPFIHGNILLYNGLNGVTVEGAGNLRENAVVNVNSLWTGTDFTYIIQSTITMGGSFLPPRGSQTSASTIPQPAVTLTVQSTLPGTVLADGSVVARPGVPVIIKTQGAAPAITSTSGGIAQEVLQGAGFVSGIDNGVDPSADPLVDIGVNSSMRFLGIGANQNTGQARVPVVITSIHDSTVGTTVRGVSLFQAIPGDTTAPAAGDGGNIIFGQHTANSYNVFDPRQGNLIDNVDLRYLGRVEQIGGGFPVLFDTSGQGNGYTTTSEPNYQELLGLPLNIAGGTAGAPSTTQYGNQFNGQRALTITDSNFSNFSEYGFWAHADPFAPITYAANYTQTPNPYRGPTRGEGTISFLANNTFSNIAGTAIQLDADPSTDNMAIQSPNQMVLLNNTFYNNGTGVATTGPAYNNKDSQSATYLLAMNNIFDGQGTAENLNSQIWGTQNQYNLYYNNGTNIVLGPNTANTVYLGDNHPMTGDPMFVNPGAGNFNLGPNSAAIDAARSEVGPLYIGDAILPSADQVFTTQIGIRDFNLGRQNPYGWNPGSPPSSQDFVALPGSTLYGFATSWVPVLATTPGAAQFAAQGGIQGTWVYVPLPFVATQNGVTTITVPSGSTGSGGAVRDQNGNQRVDDYARPNLGGGSVPFYDIGAFEYIQTFPPHVTGTTATYPDPTSGTGYTTRSIYKVGGIAGTNVSPVALQVTFDHAIDPTTLNGNTVLLEASNGTGMFNNLGTGQAGQPYLINLSGKLSYSAATNTLTITLGNTVLQNDEYRLVLVGTGTQVIRDTQGYALDGNDIDSQGNQTALPSGAGTPGSNFQVTFTVDSNPPSLATGTFALSVASDSNRRDGITNINQPTFTGTITDLFPPLNPILGDSVFIDVSYDGGATWFNNVGTGTTDVSGNFSVQVSSPLPDSPYNVGADGYFGYDYTKNPPTPATTNTGATVARVRVVDTAGNASALTTDPLSSYIAKGAVTGFYIDTKHPLVTAITPTAGSLATIAGGVVPVTLTFNKNVDPASFTSNSIKVVRSGGDGIFGNANDVSVAIDTSSLKFTYLGGALGAESVSFNIIGTGAASLANDVYQIKVLGTGSAPVIDIAGNALSGLNNGAASDFTSTFVLFTATQSRTRYVGSINSPDPTAAAGSRTNPYPTIGSAIAVSNPGDVVAVLPGVYSESITLKQFVTVRSADLSSSGSNVVPGDPIQTIIRPPATSSTGSSYTVVGSNLNSIISSAGVVLTELTGFTITSPLSGNPASGPVTPGSIGLFLQNSNVIVDRNYFIDSEQGAVVLETGANAQVPMFTNNVFAGSSIGMSVNDVSATSIAGPILVNNNDFVFNTYGLLLSASATSLQALTVANNIFWQNHDLTSARAGLALGANVNDKIAVYGNLFSGNGPSIASSADDTYNVNSGFNPASLQANFPDATGNFTGAPAFVSPRDPRPTADGPAVFFLDDNLQLTGASSAIDRSNASLAPATDSLYRGRVYITGHAFPGTGPADVGAFEYNGTGGITPTPVGTFGSGGSTTGTGSTGSSTGSGSNSGSGSGSSPTSGSSSGGGSGVTFGAATITPALVPAFAESTQAGVAPKTVAFSLASNVDRSTVTLNDLIISGSGVSLANPVQASSLSWVDDHTVAFNLTGGYNKQGTVTLAIPAGAIRNTSGQGLSAADGSIRLVAPPQTPFSPVAATTSPSPSKKTY